MYSYEAAIAFINGFSKHGSPVKDLSRFSSLMASLGNPQDNLKYIHIAGTNGKGSTIRFCSSVLISAGYKVGEFTSPFIVDYTDRITVNNENIPHECVAKYAEIVEKAVGGNKDYSQFEITTAIAFLHFAEEKCDIICLETGVGGLLDCTNIVKNTLVSIITAISFDHTKILGDTLEKIARQKAGIIKPGSNAVLAADNSKEVIDIVSRRAEEKNSSFIMPDTALLTVKKCDILVSKFIYDSEEYVIEMAGKHQICNAISAIEAIKILNAGEFHIPQSAIKSGLLTAKIFARAEVITEKPLLLIDGAHNPSGAMSLAGILRDMVAQKPIIMVVGMLAEKNVSESITEFSNAADKVICVDDFHPYAMCKVELADLFKEKNIAAITENSVQSAIEKAKMLGGDNGAVVICGSLYLASEARKYLA